jgi:hypothetical protein
MGSGPLNPHNRVVAFIDDYCVSCDKDKMSEVIMSQEIEAIAWVNGGQYSIRKTLMGLATET